MKNLVKITKLFDIYGQLLSNKQQAYIKMYYFDDLSLGEIANEYHISRNAIYSSIKEGINEMNHYESVLKIIERQKAVLELYEKIENKELKKKLIELENNRSLKE